MTAAPDRLAAVVVHHGDPAVTAEALASLRAGTRPPDGIVVVDHSGTAAAACGPGDRVLPFAGNAGFAAGANRGLRAAFAEGAQAAFLLNNDAVVETETLARLARAARLAPAALWAPVVVQAADPARVWSAGGALTPFFPLPNNPFYGTPVDRVPLGRRECGFLSGCAWFMPRLLWEGVGPLAEDYFLYGEDVDWCLRARAQGRPLWLLHEPAARVRHRGGSGGKDDRRALFFLTRNLARLIRRWVPPWARPLAWSWYLARWCGYMNLAHLLRGRPANAAALRAGWRAGRTEDGTRAGSVRDRSSRGQGHGQWHGQGQGHGQGL